MCGDSNDFIIPKGLDFPFTVQIKQEGSFLPQNLDEFTDGTFSIITRDTGKTAAGTIPIALSKITEKVIAEVPVVAEEQELTLTTASAGTYAITVGDSSYQIITSYGADLPGTTAEVATDLQAEMSVLPQDITLGVTGAVMTVKNTAGNDIDLDFSTANIAQTRYVAPQGPSSYGLTITSVTASTYYINIDGNSYSKTYDTAAADADAVAADMVTEIGTPPAGISVSAAGATITVTNNAGDEVDVTYSISNMAITATVENTNDVEYDLTISDLEDGTYSITIEGTTYDVVYNDDIHLPATTSEIATALHAEMSVMAENISASVLGAAITVTNSAGEAMEIDYTSANMTQTGYTPGTEFVAGYTSTHYNDNGYLQGTVLAANTAKLAVARGDKVDDYYLKPDYQAVVIVNFTDATLNKVAIVCKVYVTYTGA